MSRARETFTDKRFKNNAKDTKKGKTLMKKLKKEAKSYAAKPQDKEYKGTKQIKIEKDN